MSLEIELTAEGSLHLAAEVAARFFPQDALAAFVRGPELWLTPLRGGGGGGLILKQRNRAGDRAVLIWEALPPDTPPGRRPAFWDPERGTLRVALPLNGNATPEVSP